MSNGGGNSQQRRKARRATERDAAAIAEQVLQGLGAVRKQDAPSVEKKPVTLHPIVHYILRTVGAASLFGGAASIMIGISFWFCAACILLGLGVLAFDPWVEPTLSGFTKSKILFSAIFVVAIIAFLRFVVFVPAPLKIEFDGDQGDYPKGEKIGTLTWDCPESCADFRVTITNATGYDYDDLDVHISFAHREIILQSGEVRGAPCWFLSGSNWINDLRYYDDKGQEQLAKEYTTGSRIRCDKLPKHSMIQVIFATGLAPEKLQRPLISKHLPTSVRFRAEYIVRSRPRVLNIVQNPIEYISKQPMVIN